MKRLIFALLMFFAIFAVSGCGRGHDSSPTFVSDILSNPALDGDIEQSPPAVFTITQGSTQSVIAGIDPVTGGEFRAFLQFPLASIPGSAIISSATLDIVIDSIQPLSGTIPIRIDLVSLQTTTLFASDYDRINQPALAFRTFPIFQSDLGRHVVVDVTPLMQEAQRLSLSSFQIRILEDLGIVSPGLVEINDTNGVNRRNLAPLLEVIYF